jgi:hypothetical protein
MSFKKRFLFWSAVSIASPQVGLAALAVCLAAIAGIFGLAFLSTRIPRDNWAAEDAMIDAQILQSRRDQYQRALKDLERTTNNPQWQSAKEYWMSIGITNRPWIWLPPNPDAPPPKFER